MKGILIINGEHLSSLEKMRLITADVLSIDIDLVTPTADIQRDLGADSIQFIEIIMAIEYEFDMHITDRYVGTVRTIQDILNYIE